VGFDAAYIYVGADAGSLFVLTTRDAARGKVIAIDPTKPDRRTGGTRLPKAATRFLLLRRA